MVIQSFISVIINNPLVTFFTSVAILFGLAIAKLCYVADSRFHKLLEVIPGPPQWPLLGNTFEFLIPQEEILPKFTKWTKQYGPRYFYRLGSYWIFTIASAKDLEKLLTSTTETTKSVDYDQLIPWLGEGLLVSKGKKWASRRKMLTSAFHFKILEQFVDVFNEQSKVLVEIFKTECSNGEYFDVCPFITRCTLEIICETAMGIKMDAQTNRDTEYVHALHRMKQIQLHRSLRPWLEPELIWNLFSYGQEQKRLITTLHNFTNKVIRERKEAFLKSKETKIITEEESSETIYAKKGKKRLALLDLMLEAQLQDKDFTDEGLREETDTFMFGGHDTTAATASFTLFLIGNHPEVQDKICAELDEVFGDDRERPVTPEDLTRLKYLECCIKESMRLCSPVPLTARTLQNDFELEKGVILPKQTLVMIFLFQLHRDPEIYPDPLEYKPERFFPENATGRHPFAYVPFSAGPRNCIGQKFAMMEEKILLANVFRNLRIESESKLSDILLLADLILNSKTGIKIKILPR